MKGNPKHEKLRVDRWLWAARFFKTRSLAKSAVENGRVEINDNRIKAAKEIAQGDLLTVRRGDLIQRITVLALTDKRRSATIAQSLYKETEQSKLERAIVAEQKKIIRTGYSSPKSKPSKKDRRKIAKLRMNDDA